MSRTLAEAFAELEDSKYTRAVWTEMVTILSGLLDEEVRSASKGIAAEGCTKDHVPQKVIRRVLDEVNEHKIEPLNVQIEEIENLSVQETKKDGKKKDATVEGQKSKPKRVRAVRPTARKKAKGPG